MLHLRNYKFTILKYLVSQQDLRVSNFYSWPIFEQPGLTNNIAKLYYFKKNNI